MTIAEAQNFISDYLSNAFRIGTKEELMELLKAI